MARALIKEVNLFNREYAPYEIDYSYSYVILNGEIIHGIVYSFHLSDYELPIIVSDVCDAIASMPNQFGGGRDIEIIFRKAFKDDERLKKICFDSEGIIFACYSLDFHALKSLCEEFIPIIKNVDLCIKLLLEGAEGEYNHPNYKKPKHYNIEKVKEEYIQKYLKERAKYKINYPETFEEYAKEQGWSEELTTDKYAPYCKDFYERAVKIINNIVPFSLNEVIKIGGPKMAIDINYCFEATISTGCITKEGQAELIKFLDDIEKLDDDVYDHLGFIFDEFVCVYTAYLKDWRL